MSTKTLPARMPILSWIIKVFILGAAFVCAFCLGLIGLSFLDDLIHYQPNMSEKTNLLIGAGVGGLCGLCAMGLLLWVWMRS